MACARTDCGMDNQRAGRGYADPRAEPLHPQTRAEIMAGRIALSETRAETPGGMDEVVIGPKTAKEINWIK